MKIKTKEYIVINVLGVETKFYQKKNINGFFFEAFGLGFYTSDLIPIWGKPTNKTAKQIAECYITSHEGRVRTWEANKNNY